MDNAGAVNEVKSAKQVEHNGLNMVLCQFGPLQHHRQQVSALCFEDIVKILKVLRLISRLEHVKQLYDIPVPTHLSQNLNFAQQSLAVDRIIKHLSHLLNGNKPVRGQMLC